MENAKLLKVVVEPYWDEGSVVACFVPDQYFLFIFDQIMYKSHIKILDNKTN